MTCPNFSDRDLALRQMMGPPTEAQLQLRKDMRRETDPRWHLLPVEDNTPKRISVWLWVAAVSLSLGASAVIAFVV